ncbi:hypothetical protein ASF98_14925 [Arthrobacter sp. Leaf337]|uniref:J domain-containing protein n=1 Tax=Arthrobacter sp. Leaf337 TaxID=1736342 RepID=UPI0007013E63|nr:J domain-containing protein [Arthrobacter sp. Leaf337]KQR62227.1 hypothetical protein ASF98_14925 [Arthrobacter sp. Leaf337]
MTNQLPDYYGVLNVARTATRQEISRAYRALMRLHHPDLQDRSGNPDWSSEGASAPDGLANSGLLGIMEAFAVLSDAKTRAEYDRALSVPHINRDFNRGRPREVPVRRVHTPQPPLLRVTPVLWERGPWPGTG